MILLPHEPVPEWGSPDVSAFRAFLATGTGQKLFAMLLQQRPTAMLPLNAEQAALSAKFREGFDSCLVTLSSLAAGQNDQPETTPDPYPSLYDDSKWEGPKLNS